MEKTDILSILTSADFKNVDGGATYNKTIGDIPDRGLFTSQVSNRPSKSWPKAQVLFTTREAQGNNTLEDCLIQWQKMCCSYEDQYLVIDTNNGLGIFNHKGALEALNEEIPAFLRQRFNIYTISDLPTDITEYKPYLRAMRTKPFLLLAGISGTGKSRIVKQLAFDSCPDNARLRQDPTSPGNYCLIEVKPNWHDSSELMGYESQIGTAHYVTTPFVKFLVKAMMYPETPFFVCLDEMNLAPVEQYYAEFLSVLESRKIVDGKITSEPLIKADVFANDNYKLKLQDDLFGLEIKEEVVDDGKQRIISGKLPDDAQKVYDVLVKEGLRIPANLIVIGTVNMDETTHQFSRKVIDRAMTIEMNLPEGEPFMDFFKNYRRLEYRTVPISADIYMPTIVEASEAVAELSADNAEKTDWLKCEIAKVLTEMNAALEGTPFKVAYRVQNELTLFFFEQWREDKTAKWSDILANAVDQILMMKVLPRVEGDEDLLEKPLARLADFCVDYPNAAKKVEEMKSRLEHSHFTSYWP